MKCKGFKDYLEDDPSLTRKIGWDDIKDKVDNGMTANEAVMIIRALPEAIWEKLCDDENAAMKLAIEALEREAEIEEKTEWVKEALDKGWFDKMREPTPEERQSVNDYIESISEELDLKFCEDAVSRQAVLDINENHHGHMPNHINYQIWQEIKALPSVELERKTRYWIDTDNYYRRWKCSECGYHTRDEEPPYCPNCGARMSNGKEFELPEAEAYPISENIVQGFKEFTELMFERGQRLEDEE